MKLPIPVDRIKLNKMTSSYTGWPEYAIQIIGLSMQSSSLQVVILMPVRDDWTSAAELIRQIDRSIGPLTSQVDVVLVDDGSLVKCDHSNFSFSLVTVRSIQVLSLRRNLGHQRAIAIGLAHIEKTICCDAVLVMDADGEDTPNGVLQLLNAYLDIGSTIAVFAERHRRSESFVFRAFYLLYRILHRVLTGVKVRVGNFSILPSRYLSTITAMSELWNHYAAAVFRSKLPYASIPIPRGRRIVGTSRMNFLALVVHGLSAISVFGDIVGARILMGSLAASFIAALGIIVVVAIRLFTDRAIPGWATYASGMLLVILFQCLTIAASFTFLVLANRANVGFLPLRDYSLFVSGIVDLYSHE